MASVRRKSTLRFLRILVVRCIRTSNELRIFHKAKTGCTGRSDCRFLVFVDFMQWVDYVLHTSVPPRSLCFKLVFRSRVSD